MVKPGNVLAVVGAAAGGLAMMNRALAKVGEPAGIGGEERRYLARARAARAAGRPDCAA